MLIDFDTLDEEKLAQFKGGEQELLARMFYDGLNRIMKARLAPGASIGYHLHDASSEIFFITRGHGHVRYDDRLLPVSEGSVHYCRKGHSHSLVNDSDDMLEFYAVVAAQ